MEMVNSEEVTEIELKVDHSGPLPLHIQVENLLRTLIELPEYKNGKMLPKEVELAKRLGISRNTIRQATNKLKNENLLERKKGVGTRTIKNTVSTKLVNWVSFSSEMNSQGMDFHNFKIKVDWVPASSEVADMLRIQKRIFPDTYTRFWSRITRRFPLFPKSKSKPLRPTK
jgi:GntR family transcriptional regulator